jgi:KipI family sensor histidine kinase inhibitor
MTDVTKINSGAALHALGDAAVTIEFGARIGRDLSARVLAAQRAIEAAQLPGVREYVPTFRSLTVHYDPAVIAYADLAARIGALPLEAAATAVEGTAWRVPVLYDGPDLEDVAREAGIGTAEVTALHAGQIYHVYMLGFLPGFAYLGDLPERLRLPRLKVPRTRVPAGAVAIADELTAIYPVVSPGGWRLIGRTDVAIWDLYRDPPALLAAGTTVQFVRA